MTVATAIVASARLREESRGAHWRDDFEGRPRAVAWPPHRRSTTFGMASDTISSPARPTGTDGQLTVDDLHQAGRDSRGR